MRLAAVTMVYNEPDFLPIWLRHYGAQIGAAHCTVVDHGSDDGSTMDVGGANLLRLPRSPQDDTRRAEFISDLCGGLLRWYDAVIHTDVDELLVADPALHGNLAALAAAMAGEVATAVGFNVRHLPRREAALDPGRAVSAQRRWVQLVSSMCKPVLIRRAVRWAPGFHSCDAPIDFAPLYLFHLRYADRTIAMRRLARSRAQPWADPHAAPHQRMSDADGLEMFARGERLLRREGVTFDLQLAPIADLTRRLVAGQEALAGQTYRLNLNLAVPEVWALPGRFLGTM